MFSDYYCERREFFRNNLFVKVKTSMIRSSSEENFLQLSTTGSDATAADNGELMVAVDPCQLRTMYQVTEDPTDWQSSPINYRAVRTCTV